MKARSSYVPRLEKLEDRSIPGSLLGLADPSLDLFANLLAPESALAPVRRLPSRWSDSSKVERNVPALPTSLDPSASPLAQRISTPRVIPAGLPATATGDLELAIAALAASTIAAGPRGRQAAAPRVQITSTSTVGAFAFFNHTQGCITTDISILANVETARPWPPKENDSTTALHGLVVFVNDDCENQPLIDAQGFSTDPEIFRVAPDLRSATLSGTFSALNVTDGTSIIFTVSATWVATGRAVSETVVNRFDGSLEVFRTQERPAIASGTVIAGTTNYLPGPTADAAIQAVQTVAVSF